MVAESGITEQGSRFVMMSGARLLRSGLTGRIYAVTRWKEHLNGTIEAVKKFDVTDDFHAIRDALHVEVAAGNRAFLARVENNEEGEN